MKTAAVIFDLDATLVDSSRLDQLRKQRQWKECAVSLHQCEVFPGMVALLAALNDHRIPFAVVTSSVSFYASAVLNHFQIPCGTLVAYHDTTRRKPDPEPVLRAMQALKLTSPSGVVGVGDAAIDCSAYLAAGLMAVGAGWSPQLDRAAPWSQVAASAEELAKILGVSLPAAQ